ncbi:MAG TPA: YtxH domain-containing protein, partial [Nitrosospira sp.]
KEVPMSDRNPFGAFVVGFLVGGVTAAVTALLLAPQSGEETRTLIKDKSIELRDKAQQTYEETIARAEAVISEASRQIRRQPEVESEQPEEPLAV